MVMGRIGKAGCGINGKAFLERIPGRPKNFEA